MIQGLLLIDKSKGITSFSAVSRVKWLLKEKRVGHTGTLDPMATGVLPVFVGRATALSSFLLEADKRYTATFRFGIVTDTDDITGNVIAEKNVNITKNDIISAIEKFTGEILQTPPIYSALKKDGVPAYKLARQGKVVNLEPRQVKINFINVVKGFDGSEITLDISCSKGTYIRSLCHDIGEYLSCGATLSALRRTATSGFTLEKCVPLDSLDEQNIYSYLLNEETAVDFLPFVQVTEKQALRFSNGGQLDLERLEFTPQNDGELVRVRFKEKFIGIGQVSLEKRHIAVKCLINILQKKD